MRDRSFLEDVLRGLASRPKKLPPKYFYDAEGSQLFEAICELPEYYLTRTELSILEANVGAIAKRLPERIRLVEPGAGSATKTRLLLRALGRERCTQYVPVDVAGEMLSELATRLARELAWLTVEPRVADFAKPFDLPRAPDGVATVVFFPGSTLGNFDPADAVPLLGRFGALAGPGGALLLGVDLKKTPSVLHAAYNDARGVTAAFDKNVLVRINRELGADFVLDAFDHHALYDPAHGRIEMHLVSKKRQRVTIAERTFLFREGESVCTEHSYKYDLPQVAGLALRAGLVLADAWLDGDRRFATLLFRPVR